ncbi:hypothetical protein J7E90_31220 [Streptomyces sp. ISL-111]|uniref:hypothetical protein n=1 Tax=Streptomyces sp. ISL-111 TaxID=2819175 RepID=UPI001BEB2F08|nr:hypothetical protein [Streptomyces sp. ISL-111]MBT2381640.1 hypothetical protein [Streptomyces sp. ISL-111]
MAAVVVVIAGLLHAWRNTNVLTADRLCGDLVSAERVDAVLPGSGRLDAEGDGMDDDLTDTRCRVEKSSVVLGSAESRLTVRLWGVRGYDPLTFEREPYPPGASFFSGEVTGGVDAYKAWVMLPEKCWTDRPVVAEFSIDEPAADRTAFAALATDTVRTIAARTRCGDLPEKPGTLVPPRSDAARPVSEGQVCGLDGLTVVGQVPTGTKVLEEGQQAPAALWACKLTMDDETRGFVRSDGFMKYSATRDPLLIDAMRKFPGTAKGTAPDGREAENVDKGAGFILPCADGGSLYLAVDSGQQYLEASKRHEDLPKRDAYVAPFMKAAARTFGCAAPEAG